jgi:hypothetical protein
MYAILNFSEQSFNSALVIFCILWLLSVVALHRFISSYHKG